MAFDSKDYYEAIAEAPVTSRWAAGAGACGGLILALLLSALPEPGASLKTALGALLVFALGVTFFGYKRTHARGLQRAARLKSEFVAEAQAAARNEIREALNWVDVSLISAEWNRVHHFVQVRVRIFSPALEPRDIRSVDLDDGRLAPIRLQIVLPGLQNFMIPLQPGDMALSIGGDKGREQILLFRRAGSLPPLGLTPDTRASIAQFELHTNPRLQSQAMIEIVGEP